MGGSLKVLLLGVSKTGGCDLWCQKNRQRMCVCVCVFFEVCLHFRKCKEGMICMMFGDLPENIVHFLGYGIPCLTQDRQHMLFWCILCFDCPFLWISPPPPKKKRVVVELGKMTWTCLVLWFWSFGSAFQFVGFFWGSQSKGVPTKHDNFCGYVQPFWCFFFFHFFGVASKDCTCFKKCHWKKSSPMKSATTRLSVCWRKPASGNKQCICSRVCRNKKFFRILSASILLSVLWKRVSNGKVLCTCSNACKNSA